MGNYAETSNPIETLFESKELVFMADVPLVLENTAIIIDRTKGKLFARCTFRSISDKPLQALMIDLHCQDVWGTAVGEPISFQYLDLTTKRDTTFGQTAPIELKDKTVRKIQVSVQKIMFADGTVASCGGIAFTMPAPVLLREHFGSEDIAAEFSRETNAKAQFVPAEGEHYWFCACGALNTKDEATCHSCGCTMEQFAAKMDPEQLKANMLQFAAEKKAAAEKAQAEQAERVRLAEEQTRQERINKELIFKAAQRKKRRKKTITAIIISLVLVAAIGCGVIFFGIPYLNYRSACNALENDQYDTAYQGFLNLDGFLDSAEMALKTQYQKGKAALEDKQYDAAIQIFTDLGKYEDSAEMAQESKYQKALTKLSDKEYDDAINIFSELGSYKDSKDQVLEAKYLKAVKLQDDKKYKEAYLLFEELGSYKSSKDDLLATIILWEAEALGSSTTSKANTFTKTVKLNSSQYDMFYSTILIFITGHGDADFWHKDSRATVASRNVLTMLKELPSSYKDTSTLTQLFNILTTGASQVYEKLFCENETLARKCWSLLFVQDLAEHDDSITYFLRGYWTGSGYYINFYEKNGGTSSQFDLPWVAEPAGTKYYDIEDMIYYWVDNNSKHLAKVFRFTIIDYDTIEVYCYENGRTYRMYR